MERRIAAIFAADMVGYSRLMEADEVGTLARHKRHQLELIDPKIKKHGGKIIKLTGDGMIAEFPSVVEAVQCAVAIQAEMEVREADEPDDRRIRYRVAINLGDVIFEDHDVYGDGVNIAARLEALADPGGVVVSGTAYEHLKSNVNVGYEDLGEQQVKNIARPVRAWRVLLDPDQAGRIVVARNVGPRYLTLASIVAVAMALAIAGWWWTQGPDFKPVEPSDMAMELPLNPSIAVMPFKVRGDADDGTWIADAVTDGIVSILSNAPDMVVIAHSSMLKYRDQDADAAQVAQEMGVRYVLSGSVLLLADAVRVTVELADAINGKQIWALQEESSQDELMSLLDAISQTVFEEMSVSLTVGEDTRNWIELAGGFDNYVPFINGRAEIHKWSPEGYANAERILRPLYDSNPDTAFANYLMGNLLFQKVFLGISADPAADWAEAHRLAKRAVETQEFGEGYTLLAMIAVQERRHDDAISLADKSLALSPGSAEVNAWSGQVKATSGQTREGLEHMELGMRLEPDYPQSLPQAMNFARLELGRFDEARQLANEVLASDFEGAWAKPAAVQVLAVVSVFEGDMEAAQSHMQTLLEIFPQANAASARQIRAAYRNQDFVDRFVSAAVEAGLPEN